MAIGLKQKGPLGFTIAGNGAHTYDTDGNFASLEAQLGSGANNITAHAGGGQGSATPLTTAYNRVTTVATAADSVLLGATTNGPQPPTVVRNDAATNSLNVFPSTGDAINNLAANAAFAVPAGKSAIFFCVAAGQWITVLSA
ncbi:MAG TPA: hypothetical protein VFB79_15940 [Candidatus Angelobacter sp.]|nr:hypothetical protein [Candidatus Angelobacter sp.]